jgi:hypothetical protein
MGQDGEPQTLPEVLIMATATASHPVPVLPASAAAPEAPPAIPVAAAGGDEPLHRGDVWSIRCFFLGFLLLGAICLRDLVLVFFR